MNRLKIKGRLLLMVSVLVIVTLPVRDVLLSAQIKSPSARSAQLEQEELIRQFKTNRFLDRIEAEITLGESDLSDVNRKISAAEEQILATAQSIETLNNQLANLDLRIAAAEKNIEEIVLQIEKRESEITDLQYRIEQKKIEISYQKQLIMEYLRVMFKDNRELENLDGDGESINTIKLLLEDGPTGEKLRSIRYSEALEEQGREIFEKMEMLLDEQEADQQIMEVKRHNLLVYYQTLADERSQLALTREAKQSLLEQTKGEEAAYRQLLEHSKSEQEEVLTNVNTLRDNLLYIRERIDKLGDQFNPDDYADLFQTGENKTLLQLLTSGFGEKEFPAIWPASPARGITAYFRDPSYARFFGFAHNAIDIRANQGTPIKAPAAGIVYKAKDNGFGYSYIQIVHDGGFLTTYGHISEIMVSEGEMVEQGDVIGLSGGMPGTRGAGVYTTGPHLHFEIIKDGLYVDPLEYMDLTFVPLDNLPEKYVNKALGDRKKIRRGEVQHKVRRQEVTAEDYLATAN
jgi:murein DD-endopeptidase MepM/ murein hydrolase activator NlpD